MPDTAPPEHRRALAHPLTAADIMTPGPRTCSPFSTVTEAALIFRDEDCGAVPVLEDGKPVGILTDRDIALALADHPDLPHRTVAEVMSPGVVAVPAEAPLRDVEARFEEAKVRRLLVVDHGGRVEGIIAWSDLARNLPREEIGRVVAAVSDRRDAGGVANQQALSPDRPCGTSPPQSHIDTAWAWASPRAFWGLVRTAFSEWMEDKVPRLGAALSYYSVLSIAPLLIIAIAVAGLVFGRDAASGQLVAQLRGMVGEHGAAAIQEMLANAQKPRTGGLAAILGIAALFFGAMGVFGQLQDAMNTIWEVQPRPGRGWIATIKDRFLSFVMVLGTGFLLLVSLILSTAVSAITEVVRGWMPIPGPILQAADTVVSAVVVAILFAMIFKLLPDAKISWTDVWVGAGLTTVLFVIGKWAIGLYLGRSAMASSYGAAGSLVVLLVWIYYSAQILFFGAEFTQVYANRYGSRIKPAPGAETVTAESRAQQGIPRDGNGRA
jgi:membrane protein